MNKKNDLLNAATQEYRNSERLNAWRYRNSERLNAWRYRYMIQVGRYPDGDIAAHRRAAYRHLQGLRAADAMAARVAGARSGGCLLSPVRA